MLNQEMKKKMCERIVAELKKTGQEPTQENIETAFFFLQTVVVPDGFRVDRRGYKVIEKGIRISVSRRYNGSKNTEELVADEQVKEDLLAKLIEINQNLVEKVGSMQDQLNALSEQVKAFANTAVQVVPVAPTAAPTEDKPITEVVVTGVTRSNVSEWQHHSRTVVRQEVREEAKDDFQYRGRQHDFQGGDRQRSEHIRTPQFGGRRYQVEGRGDRRLPGSAGGFVDRSGGKGETLGGPITILPEGVDLNRNPDLHRESGQTLIVTPAKPAPAPKPKKVETPAVTKCQKELEDGKPTVYFMGVPFSMRPDVARLATIFEARFVDAGFSVSVLEKKLKQTKSAAVQMGRVGLKELNMSKAAKDAACFFVQDERPATVEHLAEVIKKVETHLSGCRT